MRKKQIKVIGVASWGIKTPINAFIVVVNNIIKDGIKNRDEAWKLQEFYDKRKLEKIK